MRRLVLLAVVPLALALLGAGQSGAGAAAPAPASGANAPVSSLEPLATQKLWSRLTTGSTRAPQSTADCRPLRAVFYAASDWLRLATKLAAARSACAEYYISVPPLVADKTQFRRNQASQIRALGSNFHAMAEVHFATWTRWVASTGSSWHAAGVTARQRMAEAGYDVAQGDTWVLNELTSAVRRGEGNARANVRDFLRGLYEGDGTRPTRGAVFVIGFGQRTADVSLYQNTLQSWLADSAFWTEMATYVSDWSQEVYGDVRTFAVPGTPPSLRRDYLNDYLQHKLLLAAAGPEAIEPARAFLRETYSPLANAAWPRDSAYGWTAVPVEQMAAYVSSQVHALRYFSATTGQPRDHWGFAWAPRNTTGMPAADFTAQTGALLDRLAAAIRDSGDPFDAADPGGRACGPPGQNLYCAGDVAEARFTEAWKSFRTWTQAVLRVGLAPEGVVAGTPSPMTLSLGTTSGVPVPARSPLAVTLSSSSPQGTFSTSPAGPWTPTLAVTIPAGGTSAAFYYLDTVAGSHVLTAAAAGATSAAQPVTVAPGAPTAVRVAPPAGQVRARGTRRLTATATDAFGNAVQATFTWRVTPAAVGRIVPGPRGTATFTAGRLVRGGVVEAIAPTAAGPITGTAHVTVAPAALRIVAIAYRRTAGALQLAVTARDGARRPVARALVSVVVARDGRRAFGGRATTGASGRARFALGVRDGACFVTRVARVRAAGFVWDGRTPRNRFCLRRR